MGLSGGHLDTELRRPLETMRRARLALGLHRAQRRERNRASLNKRANRDHAEIY